MLALYWQCHANQAGWARNSRYVGSLGKTDVPWRVELKTSEPQHVNELFRDPNVWIWRKLDHPLQIKQQDIISPTTAKLHQSCLTLCNPIDGSPSGSSIPGILQARILEWVAISFSNEWKWKVKSESESAQSCLTLWDPMDCSLPGSSIHGIFQARVLEFSHY